MAFGDVKGTKTGSATSITASMPCATGTNFAVVVGDLIVSVCAEQTAMTVTACADNLGNTYTALGAGADAGTVTGRAFYTRVTVAGTISSVTFTATASSNNCVTLAAGFEGPFAVSPVDAAPTSIINDNTTPYTCPATGVLAQADEKIVNVIVHNGAPTFTATAPNLKAIELATASVLKAAIGHQTVAATTSVSPAWTSSATPTSSGYGTASFKKELPPPTADAWNVNDKTADVTLSNSDKTATGTTTGSYVRSTQKRANETAGKHYAEFDIDVRTANSAVALCISTGIPSVATDYSDVALSTAIIRLNGNTTGLTVGGSSVAAGAVICVAWDAGAEKIWWRKDNGNWNNNASADPATGANGLDVSVLSAGNYALRYRGNAAGEAVTIRTEAAEYMQKAPSGFLSWMGETLAHPLFRSQSSTAYANRFNTTVTAPAGIVDGDILILTLIIAHNTAVPTPILPAGFTELDSTSASDSSAFSAVFRVAWKRASGETGDYLIQHTTASAEASIAVYSGCIATGSPVDVYSKNSVTHPTSAGVTATATSITTTVADTRLLFLGHNWTGGAALTPPTDFIERFDSLIYTADRVQATAAATGAAAHLTGNPSNQPWSAFLVALKPSTGVAAIPGANVWSGSAWVEKPAKVWSGSAWTQKPVKVWNGSAWT